MEKAEVIFRAILIILFLAFFAIFYMKSGPLLMPIGTQLAGPLSDDPPKPTQKEYAPPQLLTNPLVDPGYSSSAP